MQHRYSCRLKIDVTPPAPMLERCLSGAEYSESYGILPNCSLVLLCGVSQQNIMRTTDIRPAPPRILHDFICFIDARYDGSWVDDQRHGQGTYVYASRAVYEGGWEEGRMHGRGCYTSASGSRYDGAYR